MTEIIFCEEASDVSWARRYCRDRAASASLVALTPEAAWACQQHELAYLKLESFYEEKALFEQRTEVFREEIQWIHWLDQFLIEHVHALEGSVFRPAEASAFSFQFLFNEFFAAHYILRRLLQKLSPNLVWARPRAWVPRGGLLHFRTLCLPALVPSVCQQLGIRSQAIPAEENPAARTLGPSMPSRARGSFLEFLGQIGILGEILQGRELGFWRSLRARCRRPSHETSRWLVLGCGSDLNSVVLSLRERRMKTDWISVLDLAAEFPRLAAARRLCAIPPTARQMIEKELAGLWPTLLTQERFWSPLRQWGVEDRQAFQSLFQYWWTAVLPRQWEIFQWADALFTRRRYASVLSWEAGSGTMAAPIMQAARAHQIPTAVYQHGSSSRMDGISWYAWLAHADLLLTYGPGATRHIENTWPMTEKSRTTLATIGSARLDAVCASMRPARVRILRKRLQHGDRRPMVLYIPTVFGSWGRAFSDLAAYPDVSYFELQQKILTIFKDFPGIRLLYKNLSPANTCYNPVPEFIKTQIPDAQLIERPSLAQLVWAVDAIIVDHAITALNEALLTTKPLLVYDAGAPDCVPEARDARAILRERATVSETAEEFVRDVRAFLAAGHFSELPDANTQFLSAYGTHLNDGRSAERAIDEIVRLRPAARSMPLSCAR